MSGNRNPITPPKTFAEQVGQVAMDAHTSASVAQVSSDELFGQFLLCKLSRAGLRIVHVTDDNITADEATVELPGIDPAVAVRVMEAPALNADAAFALDRTDEIPAFLRKQAE
jgi:hypothetical protein